MRRQGGGIGRNAVGGFAAAFVKEVALLAMAKPIIPKSNQGLIIK
jgi:hypothetical protein